MRAGRPGVGGILTRYILLLQTLPAPEGNWKTQTCTDAMLPPPERPHDAPPFLDSPPFLCREVSRHFSVACRPILDTCRAHGWVVTWCYRHVTYRMERGRCLATSLPCQRVPPTLGGPVDRQGMVT